PAPSIPDTLGQAATETYGHRRPRGVTAGVTWRRKCVTSTSWRVTKGGVCGVLAFLGAPRADSPNLARPPALPRPPATRRDVQAGTGGPVVPADSPRLRARPVAQASPPERR